MHRFGLTLVTLLLSVAVSTAAGAEAPTAVPDQAVAYQINPAHSGLQTGDTLAPPLNLHWSRSFAGVVSYPLIAHGDVYVTVPSSGGTTLQALSQLTGATIWSRPVGSTYSWS